ncbi:hypothetical protein TNCV_765391 [Trichonephila clavipes]|nr:hypothetical protein TNCV_765391 [Trichonephila clavipes]
MYYKFINIEKIFQYCLDNDCGCSSLEVKVTDSWVGCHDFEPRVAVDWSCRGHQSMLNLSRFKRPPIGVMWKLREGSAGLGVVVT